MSRISRPEGEFLYEDGAYKDVTKMTNRQLDKYINDLIFSTWDQELGWGRNISTYLFFLLNATAEKNARSSSRLAKIAIGIALLGLVIAIVGIWQ